jgi:transposase, IS30 family
MKYKQITRTERVVISNMIKLKFSYTEIANHLNRNKGSISREVKRNSYLDPTKSLLVYDPDYAHKKKKRIRVAANKQQIKLEFESKKYPNLEKYIIEKLKIKWSPEQIAGRMKIKTPIKNHLDKEVTNLETIVSHETIYKYIYSLAPKELEESKLQTDQENHLRQLTLKVELSRNLRHNKGQFNRYRTRHGTRQRAKDRDQLNKKRIDTRPAVVEARSRIGDWEGDTIVGLEKNQHILTLVERKSKYLKSRKLNQATANETKTQIIDVFQSIPNNKKHTQTYDNGVQFSKHESIQEITKVPVYFAYPYHSWERGTNENTNGLLRQYFPKKTPFNTITQKDLDQVVKEINNRPRKTLDYLTPDEVFNHDMKF